jgi:uncharacterized membrane protein YvbJ
MKCPKCGTENPPGRVLCVKCGTRLRAAMALASITLGTPEATATMMRRLRGDIRKLIIVFAIIVAVMVALGMVLR